MYVVSYLDKEQRNTRKLLAPPPQDRFQRVQEGLSFVSIGCYPLVLVLLEMSWPS